MKQELVSKRYEQEIASNVPKVSIIFTNFLKSIMIILG